MLDIEATNGHQPVVRTRSTATCEPSTRTSSTTPMSTIEMPRSAQQGSYTSRSASRQAGRSVMRSSPRVDGDPEASGRRGARRVGGLARGTRAGPSPCRGRSRRATTPQPSGVRSATHSHTLPASCSAPNGLAPPGCAVTGTVQPQPASRARAQRLVEGHAPRDTARASAPRASASHSSAVGSRPPRRRRAERLGLGPRHVGRRMVGQHASGAASCPIRGALDDRIAPDQHPPQHDLALLAGLADAVAPCWQLHERVQHRTIFPL